MNKDLLINMKSDFMRGYSTALYDLQDTCKYLYDDCKTFETLSSLIEGKIDMYETLCHYVESTKKEFENERNI